MSNPTASLVHLTSIQFIQFNSSLYSAVKPVRQQRLYGLDRIVDVILDSQLSIDNHVTAILLSAQSVTTIVGAASHPSVAARRRSLKTSLQYCYNSPRLLQLTHVQYIQLKLSKASESAQLFCHVLCYKFQDSHTPLLCCGHYTGFQSISV